MRKFIDTVPITKADCNVQFTVISVLILIFFQGLGCCSDYSISFHYMSPSDMYLMDYLLYHLKPYGLVPQPGKVEHFKSDT